MDSKAVLLRREISYSPLLERLVESSVIPNGAPEGVINPRLIRFSFDTVFSFSALLSIAF